MKEVNNDLKKYIETKIFPQYQENDLAHNLIHINYVINRSLLFSSQFPNINIDMIYTIAAFHDIGHHINKNKHEKISAEIFLKDEYLKNFFTDSERTIIKEAIEDHRASLKKEPRSIYGKIISSADRNTSIESSLNRTYEYIKKHHPEYKLGEIIETSYNHIKKKYGEKGYAKNYCIDQEYDIFKKEIEELLKDKIAFDKKYREVNNLEKVTEQAKLFAIKAHHGQIRKNEPEKPMIIHPIGVAKILEQYKYDEHLIAAAYLHDVVEDTNYSLKDIRDNFGSDIANLVSSASEPDKSLSWEERKQYMIDTVKNLSLRQKLLICADKINNIEDLIIKFQKTGIRDFSNFKRGEEQQKWYYTNIYRSLINNEDKNLEIFQTLKKDIDILFYKKEDTLLKEIIFKNEEQKYEKLLKLHAQKEELKKLKDVIEITKPFIIEFSGTPRTGKTTTINNLYDFFKKGGFNISIIEEFTTSKFYKENFKKLIESKDVGERNILILKYVYEQLLNEINLNKDIILIDRSINDRQIWNYRRYLTGDIEETKYLELKEKYKSISKNLIDYLVLTYADPITSLKRDYLSSLALEKRSFLNIDNINNYNKSLKELEEFFKESTNNYLLLDTSNTNLDEVSYKIASAIIPAIREKYLKILTKKY